MKTKNKYKIYKFLLEDSMTIFVSLIWIIAAIFLVYLVFYGYQEEFTIYKEECENKRNTFDNGDNFLCSDGSHGFLNNTNILYELNIPCYIIKGEKQVCNQIEVDEIKIINYDKECPIAIEDKNGTKHLFQKNGIWQCYKDLEEGWKIVEYKEIKTIISKKNITKEWLEDYNCKCIVEGEECDIIENKDEVINSDGCFVTKDYYCSQYKCFENYYVSVK